MSASMTADAATPSRLSCLQTIAKARRSELPVRLLMAALGAAVLSALGCPVPAAAAWFVMVIATQTACLIAFSRFENDDDLRPPSRTELAACHTTVFAAGLWYSGLSAPFWFECGAPGKIFALMWICGAIGHVLLHMPFDRRMLMTVLASHSVALVGLPAIELALGHSLPRLGAAAVLVGALAFVGHLILAFRKSGVVSAMVRAERKRAHESLAAAMEASESKDRILAAVACELRPLKGVLRLARQLLATDLSAEQRRQAEALEDASRMLLSILGDILDYSSIESGALELDEDDVDVRRLATSLATLWRGRVEEKGLRLEVAVDADAPTVVRADGQRLGQIVSSLLSNAVKFTDAGEIRLHVGASRVDAYSAKLWIAVVDTGCGLETERVEKLFDAFAKTDPAAIRSHGGAGMGLAIARGLARLMGGDVTVSSEIGVGSRFRFEAVLPVVAWPARPPSVVIAFDGPDEMEATIGLEASLIEFEDVTGVEPATHEHAGGAMAAEATIMLEGEDLDLIRPDIGAAPSARPAGARERRYRRRRICVVEDHPLNRRVIEAALERLDCDLAFAVDGQDALDQIGADPFDLIFMDLQMPALDGFEVTRRVRKSLGVNARTPIIGLTANVLPGVREKCLAAGMDDFIAKPVELGELYKLVERTLAVRSEDAARGRA